MGNAPAQEATLEDLVIALSPGEGMVDGEPVTTTLAEHGPKPVMGPFGGSVAFEPRSLANMVRVGQVDDSDPQYRVYVGRKMLALAAMGIDTMGGTKFKGLSFDEQIAHVAKMRMSDLMYLSAYRLATGDVGKVATKIDQTCASCGGKVNGVVHVDIGQLQVITWPVIPSAYYRLIHPWRLNEMDVEIVKLQPPALGSYFLSARQEQWESEPTRDAMQLAAAIVEVNGMVRRTTFEVLAKTNLHPDDVESMNGLMSRTEGQLASGVNHPHECGATMPVEIEWKKGFFWHSGA